MRIRHAACLVRLCALLVLFLPALPRQVAAAPPRQDMSSHLMVYHELTKRPEGSPWLDSPVLSGDGRRAIWAESAAVPTPKEWNRVFALDIDGGQQREIDAYQPICDCRTRVDVSDDGNTVVSTEGVRIRVLSGVATFGQPREVIRLADDVIGALRLSGDGKLVVFVVERDTSIFEANPRKRGVPVPRGVWAMAAAGGELIHLAGVREIAAVSEVPVAELEADPNFVADAEEQGLDVSDDGRRIVFAARAESAGEGVFILGEGTPLTQLFGPADFVTHVAVSGDGQTVAFASTTLEVADVAVLSGGSLKPLPGYGLLPSSARLQLSRDGTKLLSTGVPRGTDLVEVATLATRWLIPDKFFAVRGSHLFNGLVSGYATMNAAGTRVLYVPGFDPDAANHGNLAVIELGATELGGAPLVREVHVDPDTIPLDGSKSSSVTAEVAWDGALIGVWLEILRDGTFDPTFGETIATMQEGPVADPGRVQGVFTATLASRNKAAAPGPRQLRVMSESQAADGRHHGTVLETDKTVTVGDVGLRTFRTEQAQPGVAAWVVPYWWESMPAWQAEWEVRRFHAEIQLDSSGRVRGGLLTIEVVNPAAQARDYLEDYHVTFEGTAGEGSSITTWTDISFVGTRQIERQGGGEFRDDTYGVAPMVALNDTGQLLMCDPQAHVAVDTPEQARQNCIAQALATLQPVGS